MQITHSFEWVDELPLGAAVAVRAEDGQSFVYLSRAVDPDVALAELGRVFTEAARAYSVKLKDAV
jgi:hypothetical protein